MSLSLETLIYLGNLGIPMKLREDQQGRFPGRIAGLSMGLVTLEMRDVATGEIIRKTVHPDCIEISY